MTKKKPAPQKPAEKPNTIRLLESELLRVNRNLAEGQEMRRYLAVQIGDADAAIVRMAATASDIEALIAREQAFRAAADTVPVTVAPTERVAPAKLKAAARATGRKHVE